MSKEIQQSTGKPDKGGFRPFNKGYSAEENSGYVPRSNGTALPDAPIGGTGQTHAPVAQRPAKITDKK